MILQKESVEKNFYSIEQFEKMRSLGVHQRTLSKERRSSQFPQIKIQRITKSIRKYYSSFSLFLLNEKLLDSNTFSLF